MLKLASANHFLKREIIPKVMTPIKAVGIEKILFKENQKKLRLTLHNIYDYTVSSKDKSLIPKAKKLLNEAGILIINDFFQKNTLKNVDLEIIEFINKMHEHLDCCEENFGKYHNILWQYHGYQYSGSEIASMPIINIRNKDKKQTDGGMIDIFNVDQVFDETQMPLTVKTIEKIFNKKLNHLIAHILPHSNSRKNLYVNDSVRNTRGPHRDDYHSTYKVFVYLTDVNSSENGPYAFLPGSHLNHKFLKTEILLNNLFGRGFGDISDIPEEFFLKCMGKKGTIIISDQSAIHMGLPQSEGNIRLAMVKSLF